MISKIAEAVFDNCCPGIRYTEEDKVFYEQMIKIVLKTMREPSDKMKKEGAIISEKYLGADETVGYDGAEHIWEMMIDAALNE